MRPRQIAHPGLAAQSSGMSQFCQFCLFRLFHRPLDATEVSITAISVQFLARLKRWESIVPGHSPRTRHGGR